MWCREYLNDDTEVVEADCECKVAQWFCEECCSLGAGEPDPAGGEAITLEIEL